jgi:hypothetical protein
VASLACGIALGGGAAINAATDVGSPWPSERVLGMISGVALALYALYLFKGWYEERQEARAEARTQRAADALASIVATARASEAFFQAAQQQQEQQHEGQQQGRQQQQQQQQQQGSDTSAEADGGVGDVWIWIESFQNAIGLTPSRTTRSSKMTAASGEVTLTRCSGVQAGSTPSHLAPPTPVRTPAPRTPSRSATRGVSDDMEEGVGSAAHGCRPVTPAHESSVSGPQAAHHDAGANALPTDLSSAETQLVVERCRALMQLRAALGEPAYASRKRALLEELLAAGAAHSLEDAAGALGSLHSAGFLETGGELTTWADILLGTQSAAGKAASATSSEASTLSSLSSSLSPPLSLSASPSARPRMIPSSREPSTPARSSSWRGAAARVLWSPRGGGGGRILPIESGSTPARGVERAPGAELL